MDCLVNESSRSNSIHFWYICTSIDQNFERWSFTLSRNAFFHYVPFKTFALSFQFSQLFFLANAFYPTNGFYFFFLQTLIIRSHKKFVIEIIVFVVFSFFSLVSQEKNHKESTATEKNRSLKALGHPVLCVGDKNSRKLEGKMEFE